MKRLLFLTYFYSPDNCAGAFRASSLVDALKSKNLTQVKVITTRPHRFDSSYIGSFSGLEKSDGIIIRRVSLPFRSKGVVRNSLNFIYFSLVAFVLSIRFRPTTVFASTSRLMTGFVGALISVVCRARFFIDIRDIFPENIALIYNETVTTLFVPFFRILESFSIKRATKVILVSAGFLPYFQSRFPKVSFKVFTHGVDSTFIFTTPTEVEPHHGKQRKTVLYAGNIGEGQGLEEILPFLAKKTEAQFDFLVYGDGARRSELLTRIKELNLTNIHVLSPISREFLANEYAKADILFLNLRKYTPFQWVIPSKIFEYAATGKPIVAGVSGYTQQFIESNLMNVEIFQPGNLEQALQALEKINLKSTDRSEFIVKYRRENIMHDLVDEIAS